MRGLLCAPSDQKSWFVPGTTLSHPSHPNICHQGNLRACTPRTRPSHRVPELSHINCKLCHAGRCYKHILSTYNDHSSEALLASLADNTSKEWHTLHQLKKEAYGGNYAWIKTMIRTGLPVSLTDRLVYFASNFSSIMPINHAVSPGFYDPAEVVSLSVVFLETSHPLTHFFRMEHLHRWTRLSLQLLRFPRGNSPNDVVKPVSSLNHHLTQRKSNCRLHRNILQTSKRSLQLQPQMNTSSVPRKWWHQPLASVLSVLKKAPPTHESAPGFPSLGREVSKWPQKTVGARGCQEGAKG